MIDPLLAVLLVLQVLDLATTYLAVSSGAAELNPVVEALLPNPWLLLLLKLAAAIIAYKLAERSRVTLAIIIALYVQAVITNVINTLHLA